MHSDSLFFLMHRLTEVCGSSRKYQPEAALKQKVSGIGIAPSMLLLLLSRFSHVRLCVTPQMAANQAPPSLGFSRQEHWSGLPFPSPVHESEKWKWSCSVVSDSSRPHGLQPTRLLHPWDFPGKSTGVGCHCLLRPSINPQNQILLLNFSKVGKTEFGPCIQKNSCLILMRIVSSG